MLSTLLQTALLLLTLSTTALTTDLHPRQAPGPSGPSTTLTRTSPQCLDYALTANLSTIGSNSTYRSAYIQASAAGTWYDLQMFAAAVAKLPALTADAPLNRACGNSTAIALTEAESNFTKGVVLQFEGLVGNPQAIRAGPLVLPIVGFAGLLFFCLGMFAK